MSISLERNDVPSKKKIFYPIENPLKQYLLKYDREMKLPLQYSDMLRFNLSTPLLDKNDKDTLWQTVYYDEGELNHYALKVHRFKKEEWNSSQQT
jgi:hypothetical protein